MGIGIWAGAIGGLFTIIIGSYKIWFSKSAKSRKIQNQLYDLRVKQRKARFDNDEAKYQELEAKRAVLLEKVKLL